MLPWRLAATCCSGGWRLLSRRAGAPVTVPAGVGTLPNGDDAIVALPGARTFAVESFEPRHWLTAGTVVALIFGVVFLKLNVGLGAFAGATILTLARAADENQSVRQMPWNVIMMVTGVTVLIALLEKTGGMDLFTDLLARTATPASSTAV